MICMNQVIGLVGEEWHVISDWIKKNMKFTYMKISLCFYNFPHIGHFRKVSLNISEFFYK
jgi:hypothetical protein